MLKITRLTSESVNYNYAREMQTTVAPFEELSFPGR